MVEKAIFDDMKIFWYVSILHVGYPCAVRSGREALSIVFLV
jgi:hypothetical protein